MATVWVCAAAFGALVRGWWCVCDPLLEHAGFDITPASTVRDHSGHHAEHGMRIDETPPTESNPPARLAGWLAPIPKLGNGCAVTSSTLPSEHSRVAAVKGAACRPESQSHWSA